jgi:hypothetical protein
MRIANERFRRAMMLQPVKQGIDERGFPGSYIAGQQNQPLSRLNSPDQPIQSLLCLRGKE